MSATAPLTLGTAGHVDHGKTTLVRALTGRDTDRLAQEKERGLSIELGYAKLRLPSGRRMSVIDVPGHERFIRTMVAGATGIDVFLLCVAADDGFMPQTHEHLAVLRALGVLAGVVAITRADVASPARAEAQAAAELPGLEAVPVATPTGVGLDELLGALERATAGLPGRAGLPGPVRLHVDRVFTLHGIGTVATGTLWSGSIGPARELLVLPDGSRVRVRSVHVHDEPTERADAGQRVALALTGPGRRELARGDVLCDPAASLSASFRLNAALELGTRARPLPRGARVQVHHGTRDAPARIVPLEGHELRPDERAVCQIRLESPLIAERGDALVLRQIAPPDTIGGGEVLDAHPRRQGPGTQTVAEPERRPAPLPAAPLEAGPGEPALLLAALLHEDGERPRTDHELAEIAGVQGSEARNAWREVERAGLAVRLDANLHFDPTTLDRLSGRVADICRREGGATLAAVRDELGTSRRYAQVLLEHLDAEKVTVRHGDVHVLREKRR